MDPYGRVLALNRPCALLNPGIEALTPEELVDATVGPGPARQTILNFAEVAHAYSDRLERRARASTDPRLRALADRAHGHLVGVPRPRHDRTNPTLTVKLCVDEHTTLSLLAAVVRFEHATDITVAELWIELLFPADGDTQQWFETVRRTCHRHRRRRCEVVTAERPESLGCLDAANTRDRGARVTRCSGRAATGGRATS
jgi:hypothetical protein